MLRDIKSWPPRRGGPSERSLNVKKLIIRVEAAEAASGSGKTNTATNEISIKFKRATLYCALLRIANFLNAGPRVYRGYRRSFCIQ